jgi:DNA damage-binding protein 1
MSFVVLAEHFGHVLALHVKTRGEFILVGDLMRSMMVLRFDEGGSKRLVLAARDTSARWLMAVESLGDNFVGADQDGNLVVMARAEDDDQHLRTVARIHVGEGINCLRPGRLVQPDPSLDQPPPVPLVLGGTSGLLAVLQPIPEAEYLSFKKLEEALAAPLVWGLSHADWRATRQQNRRGVFHKHEGIVDGDLIESFLDLNPAEQSKVASAVSVPVIELVSRIEAMARQCH